MSSLDRIDFGGGSSPVIGSDDPVDDSSGNAQIIRLVELPTARRLLRDGSDLVATCLLVSSYWRMVV